MPTEATATRTLHLYTRVEHGNLPIEVIEEIQGDVIRRRLLMKFEDGNSLEFGSTASFLRHWYGSSNNIPFSRYFKIDDGEIFSSPTVLTYCLPGGILWTPDRRLGIDLGARGRMASTLAQEVKKILFARFGRRISALGLDPYDVLQEVYKKLLTANIGRSPFDSNKASFGHYVYMVCNSAILNYSKKQRRRQAREQVGISVFEGDHLVVVDAGDSVSKIAATGQLVFSPEDDTAEGMAVSSLCQRIGEGTEAHRLACKIVVLLREGYTEKQLPKALGRNQRDVSRAMVLLQEQAMGWAAEEEIL